MSEVAAPREWLGARFWDQRAYDLQRDKETSSARPEANSRSDTVARIV